jgi:hypothetical protein
VFFYVDESGHTGANLFDQNQPLLCYGVLSSPLNLDILAEDRLRPLRRGLGVERLHAAELGNERIATIIPNLVSLQKACTLRFDVYRVAKPDHAIISFFDQVFDQGMNPAMTWTGYWTPMRYVLLLKLAHLFTDELAQIAWEARLEINAEKANRQLVNVCRALRERVHRLPDARSRQLISDTLLWAENNPSEIHYNVATAELRLSVMPNVIGFQSVMVGIASRIKKHGRRPSRITVDQQSQFNKAQRTLAEYYARVAAVNPQLKNGPGLPKLDFSGMPQIPITFASSKSSAGLEVVDIYLWVFKRILEKKDIHPALYGLVKPQLYRSRTDEISINAIAARWEKWFDELPEPTPEQIAKGQEIHEMEESRRLAAIRGTNTVTGKSLGEKAEKESSLLSPPSLDMPNSSNLREG